MKSHLKSLSNRESLGCTESDVVVLSHSDNSNESHFIFMIDGSPMIKAIARSLNRSPQFVEIATEKCY